MTSEASPPSYSGSELPTFALATNWKRYVANLVGRYIRGDVLEVGAGTGVAAKALLNPRVNRWVGVEPDPELVSIAAAEVGSAGPVSPEFIIGTVESLPRNTTFDVVLYWDVLEHISDDRREVRSATTRLRVGGHLIVIAPAFQWLFSEFDTAIGHYRRYTASSLAAVMPPELEQCLLCYADSVGMLLSVANRLLLRQSVPNRGQILFWDRVIVPISRVTDLAIRRLGGRSVIGVYRAPATQTTTAAP